MSDEFIFQKYKSLAETKLTEENFEEYFAIVKHILSNFDVEKKKTVYKKEGFILTDRMNLFMGYYILFSHKYINMIQGTVTKFSIKDSLRNVAYYDPSTQTIFYGIKNAFAFGIDNRFFNALFIAIHENRHAMQFRWFETNSIDELLEADPNSLFVLKDAIALTNNYNFYRRNHGRSLMENDADCYGGKFASDMISSFLPWLFDDYLYYSKSDRVNSFGNYFEELEDCGTISGEYIKLDTSDSHKHESFDKYIYINKCTDKMAKEMLGEYKLLQLFYNQNGTKKSYREIMKQRDDYLNSVNPNEKITVCDSPNFVPKTITIRERVNTMFDCYIKSDPMLYLESLLFDKPLFVSENNIIYLFGDHPTLYKEYKDEIDYLFKRKINNIEPHEEDKFNSLINYINSINIKHGIDSIARPNKLPSISGGPRKH